MVHVAFWNLLLLFWNILYYCKGKPLEQTIVVSSLNNIKNGELEINCHNGIKICNIICDTQQLCNNIIINGNKNNNNNNNEIIFSCLLDECNNNKFNIFGNSILYLINNNINNNEINIYGNNNQLYIKNSNFISNIINFIDNNNNNNGIYFDNLSFSINNTFYSQKVSYSQFYFFLFFVISYCFRYYLQAIACIFSTVPIFFCPIFVKCLDYSRHMH